MTSRSRPLHREPLVAALVLMNLGLGGLILYREFSTPRRAPAYAHDLAAPPGGEQLPPGHPDVSAGSMGAPAAGGAEMAPEFAAVAAAAKGGAAPASDFSLSGTVRLSSKLKAPWPQGAPVFVIARAEGGGPPFAARRYDGVKAPFAYELGPGDAMFAGAPLPKKLVVSVRVDQDGDAMTRQPGDLEGGPSAAVGPRGRADVTVDRPAKPAP